MALVVGGVSVELSANAATIVASMNQAARAVQTASSQMQSSTNRWAAGFNNAERRINSSLSGIGRGFRSLQSTFALLGVGLGVREIIRMADAYKLAGAQLRLVAPSAAAAAEVQERLFQSAQDLGVAVGTLNTIYIRASRNAATLGASQDEIFRATEALGAAIKVSGATAQEASAALFQLSQSFARGVLRGEELNSVSEQMPIILDAIAAATGKTTQEVIRFATEHGLAADLVIESVTRMRDTWVQQAATMGDTVEAAMERIRNALERAVGKGGEAGAFQPLTDSLNNFANTLEEPRTVKAVAGFGASIVEVADLILKEFADLASIISAVFEGRFSDALAVVQGRLSRFGDAAKEIIAGDYVAAIEKAIGKTEALGASIDQAQIDASYPPAAVAAAASRTATQPPLPPLVLRGGSDDASAKKSSDAAATLANNIKSARDSIANLVTSGDEFAQIQQKLDNKARDLGETFRTFTKYIKDSDEQSKALGATLAALAVEEEAAAKEIRETLTGLQQVSETIGLGAVDLGSQNVRDAVAALGEMASANDKVFATQLNLVQTTEKLDELFLTLSAAMREAGASAQELESLEGAVTAIQNAARTEAAEASLAASPFKVAAFESPQFDPNFIPKVKESELKAQNEELKAQYAQINSVAQTFAQTIAKGFTEAITGAKTFGDAIRGIGEALLEAVIQAVILQAVTAAIGTAGGGGGALGALFPVAPRAFGGPVAAGHPYMVGERGSELFVPSRAGEIVPNNQLGGGGGSNVINIDARQSTPGTTAAAVREAVRLAPGAYVNAQARGMVRPGRAPF